MLKSEVAIATIVKSVEEELKGKGYNKNTRAGRQAIIDTVWKVVLNLRDTKQIGQKRCSHYYTLTIFKFIG